MLLGIHLLKKRKDNEVFLRPFGYLLSQHNQLKS